MNTVEDTPSTSTAATQPNDADFKSALKEVFKTSYNQNELIMGSSQIIRTLLRGEKQESHKKLELVVVAQDNLEKSNAIIRSLCEKSNVPMLVMDDMKVLEELSPLKKAKKMGAIAVREFVVKGRAEAFIANALH